VNRGAILVALLMLFAPAGCKRKQKAEGDSTLVEYRDALCSCADMACIDKVNESFVPRLSPPKFQSGPDDLPIIKQAQECITNLSTIAGASATVGSGSGSAATKPALPAKREADALINAARAWQKHPKLAVSEIRISYVDPTGLLDGEFGVMRVAFGASQTPVDDPKRKTGAPVKVDDTKPATCPTLFLDAGGWSQSDSFCPDVASYIPRCSVIDIWKRAIKAGAPKDALAVITFTNSEKPAWSFEITDAPRDVNISNAFPDDCERTLEKTP